MSALDDIKAEIPDFPGCEGEEECRRSDEEVRSYVGERLAALGGNVPAEQKDVYEALLLRCEFMNQEAFKIFDEDRSEQRIAAVLDADAAVIKAAKPLDKSANLGETLAAIRDALDRRDAAMSKQ